MHIDWTAVMRGMDGRPIMGETGPLTLQQVAETALLSPAAQGRDGTARMHQYEIALAVHAGSDIQSEAIAEIKRCIGLVFAPLVVGQAWRRLENEPTGIEEAGDG